MRILAITSCYPRFGYPGMAPFNRLQFNALAAEHEVVVLAPVSWLERLAGWKALTASRQLSNDQGVPIHHPTYFYPPRFCRWSYGRFFFRSIRRVARRVIREFRPDIILACWAHPDGWAAARLAREANLPLITKVHGSDVLVVTKEERRRKKVAEALQSADGVVAVSGDLADNVVRLGVDPARVHAIPHGTDRGLFSPGERVPARARLGLPQEPSMLLFVGNTLLSKGCGVLVEACRVLREQSLPFQCHFVGHGVDSPEIQAMIERFRLSDCVHLAGRSPQEKLPDWYRAADLVVLPSFSEGIPNVLREALSSARPFVATAVGGIPEITRDPVGKLVPPGNPAALADAIQAALADPPDENLIRAVADEVNIEWKESAGRLAQLLQRTIDQFKTKGNAERQR